MCEHAFLMPPACLAPSLLRYAYEVSTSAEDKETYLYAALMAAETLATMYTAIPGV